MPRTAQTEQTDPEARILATARELFIERGFAATSMSDIAARTGIKRPVLHYYFRTKERLFQAVFGEIISSFVPQVHLIVTQSGTPFSERLSAVIDAYYSVFVLHPQLPLFVMGEMNRDIRHLLGAITAMGYDDMIRGMAQSIRDEMDAGNVRRIPLREVFLSFYGLLIAPFASRNLMKALFMEDGEDFSTLLAQWKPRVIRHMELLLAPGGEGERGRAAP